MKKNIQFILTNAYIDRYPISQYHIPSSNLLECITVNSNVFILKKYYSDLFTFPSV